MKSITVRAACNEKKSPVEGNTRKSWAPKNEQHSSKHLVVAVPVNAVGQVVGGELVEEGAEGVLQEQLVFFAVVVVNP
jgi:hypothetical protein